MNTMEHVPQATCWCRPRVVETCGGVVHIHRTRADREADAIAASAFGENRVDYETAARFLFQLLDDIDTADDVAKADDAAYRKAVQRIQKRRFEVADTDGFTVTFKPHS